MLLVPLMTVVYRAKSLVALVPVVAAFVDPGPTRVGRVEQPVAVGRIIAGLGRADVRGGGIAVAVIVLEPDGDGNVLLTGDGRGRHANGLRAGQADLAIGHRGVAG